MYGDTLADIPKCSINIDLDFLTVIINKSFRDGGFPSILKYIEVFSVLHMSKVFERLMY